MSETLGRLRTDLGEKDAYDAASICSRCGYCEQACPTYVATGRESYSGRGRNQIVRLMLEGKLKDASAFDALSTCLLCGACTTACYAHVPTAELVLEGRRKLSGEPPLLARWANRLLISRPGSFAAILKAAYFFKRLGLAGLASRLGILKLLGLSGLAAAEEHVDEAPPEFLFEILRRRPQVRRPAWLYFAACGPNYLFPRVGEATFRALEALSGPGGFPGNSCCGLLAYNYGSLEDARALAKQNIAKFESIAGELALVADCSSCAAYLKNYPQLFLEDKDWLPRAEKFSSRARDALEALAEKAGSLPRADADGAVTYHDSCRACHGQGLRAQPREVMRALCGDGFRELPESDVCCGGAGAFSFLHPELSDDVLRRKIGNIAALRARVVATSSTSCLIQLVHGLKKYYPECRAVHVSELAANQITLHGLSTEQL